MATEQQLALALNPYDPSYLQNLPMGQSQPSLLGNTTKLTSYGLPQNSDGSGAYSDPNPGWSNKSDAEKASYYSQNPTMAGITQLGQKGFGYTSLGMLQNALEPGFVSNQAQIAMGVDPAAYQSAKEGFRSSEMGMQNNVNAAFDANNATQNAQSMQSMQDAQAADTAAAQGSTTGGISDAASSAADGYGAAGSDTGGFGGGTDSGSDGWAKGGRVNKNQLTGPDPQGPDDGYGALQGGEFVVKKAAVRKYGEGMLGKINSGKFSKQ